LLAGVTAKNMAEEVKGAKKNTEPSAPASGH